MKIIKELASSTIENGKKDSFATRVSIFLAVVLLGSIIFDISFMKKEFYDRVVSTVGDYHISMSEISEEIYESLESNQNIERISFDKVIETDFHATIYEKGAYHRTLREFPVSQGRVPEKEGELLVTERFLNQNKNLKIGSQLEAGGKNYSIVGTYNDNGLSFEDSVLLGCLENEEKNTLFSNQSGLIAYIWYKNPRDTYTFTNEILDELSIDMQQAESTGRLFFNTDILEYKMIYRSGIIPPSNVISEAIETYGPLFFLSLLFVAIIYGAFNVWNNREVREIALLKSVGMTRKQVRKMIRVKAFRLSIFPILLGLVVSYFVANLLLYLIWLNNALSYSKLTNILGETLRAPDFRMIPVTLASIVLILFFSFFTVYLSAIVPARKSAALSIIEGIKGLSKDNRKGGTSKMIGKIENSLAKDYFKAYRSTYRVIILSILLSSVVMTLVLVSQSYREVNVIYNKYESPYHFTAKIATLSDLNEDMLQELKRVNDVKEIHSYASRSFKFFLEDNRGFVSQELERSFEAGNKFPEDLYVNIIGLSDGDFDRMLRQNALKADSKYVLLNKTPDENAVAYSFRNYIKVTDSNQKEIFLRYHAEGKRMPIKIDDTIDEFPYGLEGQTKNGIYVFSRMTEPEDFVRKHGADESHAENDFTIQIKIEGESLEAFDQCEKILSLYIPKSDYSTSTKIVREAMRKEQIRNEHILNFGIQLVLVVLALSNAYNSFHGNIRSRKKEFQLLFTVGMTEKQIKKMIYGESKILLRNAIFFYILVFVLAIFARSYRSAYEFGFISKELLLHINFVPILVIFGVMVLGVLLAIRSSLKKVLNGDWKDAISGL